MKTWIYKVVKTDAGRIDVYDEYGGRAPDKIADAIKEYFKENKL